MQLPAHRWFCLQQAAVHRLLHRYRPFKIATNSRLAGNKSNWIDFNAGRIVTDDLPLEDAAKELFQLVLDVASGKKVKAEIAGFHDLAIFKQGVTL